MGIADETRWLDATAQAELVRKGEVKPTELVEGAIERIERYDGGLNSFIHHRFDRARQEAAGALPVGPFTGVPFALKDLWASSAGDPICNGNIALKEAGHRAEADTTLVGRYRAAGLVFVGRTNTPEFGSLPTTEPVAFGATRNPWDTTRTSGGSSGGSAAAVAAGLVPAAHASDGGGSIRIPASACGLVGLKVTQGRISLGPVRDESILSVEHVVTRSVRDCAALLDATHGPGVGDTVIAPSPGRPFLAEVGADPGRLRIGFWDSHHTATIDPECKAAVAAAAQLLADLGHELDESHPAALDDPTATARFGAIWATNMSVAQRRVEAILGRPLVDGEVEPVNKAMAEFATHVSSTDFAMALAAQGAFRRQIAQWWADGHDLLLTPTIAMPPWLLGEMASDPEHPLAPSAKAAAAVPYTPAFNTSGQPAISLPLHWTASGLPVGVQLVAAYGREDLLLRVAAQLEAAAPWAERYPSM
ncbi:MAG TPA: amidase [Acidimicrobiales bacterium]